MTTIRLAYSHLNLRWNPFSETGVEEIPRLAVVEVGQYIDRLKKPGFALQFLGARGRGKTTHLFALHEHFPQAPYYHFAEHAPIPKITQAPLLFLDETQRLPALLRKRIFSRKVSFVVASHMDHRSEFRKAGLEYETIILRGLSLSNLKLIIERRIEWARRGPGAVPTVPASELGKLIEIYGDDLWAIFARLYDEFQVLKEVSDVKIQAFHKV